MPYQMSGYASACAERQVFFHSSHAALASVMAKAQMSVPLMLGHMPPFSRMPGRFVGVDSPLFRIMEPMGEGSRSNSSMDATSVLLCSDVVAPPMMAHGCGSSQMRSSPIQSRLGPSHARRNQCPAQLA